MEYEHTSDIMAIAIMDATVSCDHAFSAREAILSLLKRERKTYLTSFFLPGISVSRGHGSNITLTSRVYQYQR